MLRKQTKWSIWIRWNGKTTNLNPRHAGGLAEPNAVWRTLPWYLGIWPDQRRKFIVEDVNIKILQEILEDHDYFWPKQLKWPANIWGEGSGNPLQYSCLENPMDRGAWWAAVHGVTRSQTRLSDFTFSFHFHALEKEMAAHSSILAWRIPGTGEPGGLPSMGSHRVKHDWSDLVAAAAAAANICGCAARLELRSSFLCRKSRTRKESD